MVEHGVFLSLTPKAMRVQELRGQGMSFESAFAIADSEYSSNGMALKPGTTSAASSREARAI